MIIDSVALLKFMHFLHKILIMEFDVSQLQWPKSAA